MRVIKICAECYIGSEILVEEGDIIIITDIANCEQTGTKH